MYKKQYLDLVHKLRLQKTSDHVVLVFPHEAAYKSTWGMKKLSRSRNGRTTEPHAIEQLYLKVLSLADWSPGELSFPPCQAESFALPTPQ